MPAAVGRVVHLPFRGFLSVYQRKVEQEREGGICRKNTFRDFLRLLEPGRKTLNVW